jgi:hypothetical protein
MSACILMLPDASVLGDAYASGEPDAADAWTIVPLTAGPELDPRVRVFRDRAEARAWRARRMAHQRGCGKRYRHPLLVQIREVAS